MTRFVFDVSSEKFDVSLFDVSLFDVNVLIAMMKLLMENIYTTIGHDVNDI